MSLTCLRSISDSVLRWDLNSAPLVPVVAVSVECHPGRRDSSDQMPLRLITLFAKMPDAPGHFLHRLNRLRDKRRRTKINYVCLNPVQMKSWVKSDGRELGCEHLYVFDSVFGLQTCLKRPSVIWVAVAVCGTEGFNLPG